MLVVGLTGRNGAGKGVVAAFLARKGFHLHSLSDAVREEVAARGMAESRETLIQVGRELREHHGAQVLAERIFRKLEQDKNYCVDSIRHPAEIEFLRRHTNFVLLFVDAPVEMRFGRLRARARQGDPVSFERFKELEEQELRNSANAGQQLLGCQELADHTIQNAGSMEDLHARIAELILPILRNNPRPSWDEYFMGIAQMASLRSNCLKRRVAAVIVKDRRVISTGYNGTPRGIPNCNEGGCPRCNSLADSGASLEECFCSHAEENAIVQAAYHGVGVAGATIYSTYAPCLLCTKMIINSGIAEIVYNYDYPQNGSALRLMRQAGLVLRRYSRE